MKKLKVIILYGGFSDERAVSLKSGQAVYENINTEKYDAILIDVLAVNQYKSVQFNKIYNFSGLINLYKDAVFLPVLHGEFGEDGVLQYLLQSAKVKFTGSKFLAHSIAINKLATKLIAKDLGIKCARHKFFTSKATMKEFPVYEKYVVKPNNLGSSVGISIENNQKDVIIKENVPYFLEINTTPGMTETSLVPQQASVGGVSFLKLIDRLIDEV